MNVHPFKKQSLRVLNIEDLESDYELNLLHLEKKDFIVVHSERVHDKASFVAALNHRSWDLILSDFNIPGFSGIEAFSIAKELSPHTPFILVSGMINEINIVDMIKSGVEDFVLKSNLVRLAAVTTKVLRDVNARKIEQGASNIIKLALDSREQMVAIVSHDIKNPLSAIQIEAQLLLKAAEECDPAKLASQVTLQSKRILRTVERMKTLIRDLLDRDNSQKSEHDFVLVKNYEDPKSLISEALDALETLRNKKSIRLHLEIGDNLKKVFVDRERILQCFQNLISNAIKFCKEGGLISISVTQNDDESTFSIVDDGIGIDKKLLGSVFQKYWRSPHKTEAGHGLGLYICKQVVDAHEGRIGVISEIGAGAKFWLTLPTEKVNASTLEMMYSDKVIIVVDDDDELREVIGWTLQDIGFKVYLFADPILALEELKSNSLKPDLFIVDFHMPKMLGTEFLTEKNKLNNQDIVKCRSILITAAPNEIELSETEAKNVELLEKPIDLEVLLNLVKRGIKNL